MIEWLAREGWMIVSWWMLVSLAGVIAMPLAWRMLGSLPDRGYLLARSLGLLSIGFVYWLLNTLGFLRNDAGSVILSALIVLAIGLFALFRAPDYSPREMGDSIRAWWARNKWAIIVAEVLFAVMLFTFATVRAYQNAVNGTERPMDIALLASIVRSDSFPPNDPWLSGYAISYYYFGYVLAAMLTTVSGFISSLTYNLWTATLFAMTGLAAFGVVYNLVRVRGAQSAAVLTGILGLCMVAVIGNYLTPFVDEPFYNNVATQEQLNFWDVRDRQTPLTNIEPNWRIGFWWNSARVLHDRNLPSMGEGYTEVINEFPMFSYVLGDNHPHVMSLPFTLLAMAIGFSITLNKRRVDTRMAIFCGIIVGSSIFINTWDTPIYLALITAAEALRRYAANRGRLTAQDGVDLLTFFGLVVVVMLVAYLPFLVGFGSQVGGVLPNLIHPTAIQHIFLAFGAAFPLMVMFIGVEAWRGGRSLNLKAGFGLSFGFLAVLIGLLLLLVLLGAVNPNWLGSYQKFLIENNVAFGEMLAKRLAFMFTTIVLVTGIFFVAARLFGRRDDNISYSLSTGYVLLLVGGALLLILTPDYVYLRDVFSSRMNTVFKFYYQAWALLGVASAYAVWSMVSKANEKALPNFARVAVAALAALMILPAFDYPLRAIPDRMFYETGYINDNVTPAITLNGASTLTNPNDYEALLCLRDLTANEKDVVVAEVSFHGSYDYFPGGIASGRTSGITGLPVVLGWQGHESQWRGSAYSAAVGTREQDIVTLYTDLRLDVVNPIIKQYGIDYIVYGSAERTRYGGNGEFKFREGLQIVCETGDTTIYRVPTIPQMPIIPQRNEE